MEKAVVNFRIDKTTKKEMEEICEDIGISIGTAFNIFAKKLIRERRIPFELDSDPFYSKENIERLKRSIEQMEKLVELFTRLIMIKSWSDEAWACRESRDKTGLSHRKFKLK